MKEYLKTTEIIDWHHPDILSKARELSSGEPDEVSIAGSCFRWVRDEIKHIGDYNVQTIACTASEVLKSGSGICYAKSHLLAALLRANSIPAGFCYQRLSIDDKGPPFCLHGLNAVFLSETGWFRIDPRGNKEGINAGFNPPLEKLAFSIKMDGEADFLEIWPDPLPLIIDKLRQYKTKDELWDDLPDIPVILRENSR